MSFMKSHESLEVVELNTIEFNADGKNNSF
jgi:hypothetical protein